MKIKLKKILKEETDSTAPQNPNPVLTPEELNKGFYNLQRTLRSMMAKEWPEFRKDIIDVVKNKGFGTDGELSAGLKKTIAGNVEEINTNVRAINTLSDDLDALSEKNKAVLEPLEFFLKKIEGQTGETGNAAINLFADRVNTNREFRRKRQKETDEAAVKAKAEQGSQYTEEQKASIEDGKNGLAKGIKGHITKAMKQGKSFEEIMDYIKRKKEAKAEKQKSTKESKSRYNKEQLRSINSAKVSLSEDLQNFVDRAVKKEKDTYKEIMSFIRSKQGVNESLVRSKDLLEEIRINKLNEKNSQLAILSRDKEKMSKYVLREYYELCADGVCMDVLNEEEKRKAANGVVYLSGKLQEADCRNGNGRKYPQVILEREVKNYQNLINDRRALGELDHPDDSVINLKNVSHVVTSVWWNGPDVMGKIEVLNTPSGKVLQELINANIKIGISSRGLGSVRQQGQDTIVEDDFQLICFDIVSEPSTPNAFMLKEWKQRGSENNTISKINKALDDILG